MNIKKIRNKNNIKQKEVAQLIGVSVCNYSKKEAGIIKFSLDEAYIIAKYFNTSIEDLFIDNEIILSKEDKLNKF